mmetsp:Transcript_42387/g.66360  ORF Transcript_42387/g.66360 Transcript_42387/m.66360 type:complete len:579 (+) Transcript_42387:113-1849(+)
MGAGSSTQPAQPQIENNELIALRKEFKEGESYDGSGLDKAALELLLSRRAYKWRNHESTVPCESPSSPKPHLLDMQQYDQSSFIIGKRRSDELSRSGFEFVRSRSAGDECRSRSSSPQPPPASLRSGSTASTSPWNTEDSVMRYYVGAGESKPEMRQGTRVSPLLKAALSPHMAPLEGEVRSPRLGNVRGQSSPNLRPRPPTSAMHRASSDTELVSNIQSRNRKDLNISLPITEGSQAPSPLLNPHDMQHFMSEDFLWSGVAPLTTNSTQSADERFCSLSHRKDRQFSRLAAEFILDRFDSDKDGILSFEDFVRWQYHGVGDKHDPAHWIVTDGEDKTYHGATDTSSRRSKRSASLRRLSIEGPDNMDEWQMQQLQRMASKMKRDRATGVGSPVASPLRGSVSTPSFSTPGPAPARRASLMDKAGSPRASPRVSLLRSRADGSSFVNERVNSGSGFASPMRALARPRSFSLRPDSSYRGGRSDSFIQGSACPSSPARGSLVSSLFRTVSESRGKNSEEGSFTRRSSMRNSEESSFTRRSSVRNEEGSFTRTGSASSQTPAQSPLHAGIKTLLNMRKSK